MERNKLPKVFWLLAAIALISLLLNLVTIVIAVRSPGGDSYPREFPSAVDYSKISNIVAQQIAAQPKAIDGVAGTPGQNGLQGQNGTNGTNGVTGSAGTTGTPGDTGMQGEQGEPGPQGDPGQPGLTVQLRYNNLKNEIEWKYTTDLTWRPLVTTCTLTNTCVNP